ncbi:MAG: hypothetical protein Q7R99_03000 [bacterium]|nr:hypothetical protein [bacterium]
MVKIIKIRKGLLIFFLVFTWLYSVWFQAWQNLPFPPKIQEAKAAAPTYFGSSSNPADNGTGADFATYAITPPTDMLSGDLVVMIGVEQVSVNPGIALGATGGQSWSDQVLTSVNDMTIALYWAQYNGTWATDPSLSFGSQSGTQPVVAIMHAFRPASVGSGGWVLDTAFAGGAEASASPTVVSGITPVKRDTVSLAGWAIPNASTWSALSGAGWATTGLAQYRNTSGSDQSATFAHQLQGAPAATGNVSKVPSTAAAGVSFIQAWSFQFASTVALNSPEDATTTADTTPDLVFTGTDLNSDTIEYNVQIATSSTSFGGIDTFYFDGSDVVATDGGTDWFTVTNADDGSISTSASTSKGSLGSTSALTIQGTNVAGSGSITQVRARVYGNGSTDDPTNNTLVTEIYDDTQANLLGTITNTNFSADWSSYVTLSAPPGGWDFTKVQALESLSYGTDGGSGDVRVNLFRVEIEVTSTGSPLVSASSTQHTGFSGGASHPYASGAQVTYTVQDALADDTYYWRVAAIDPSGTNTYGAWSETRSFTISAVTASVSITSDGWVEYGVVPLSASKDTTQLTDTQTVQNNGSVTERFNIKTSNATSSGSTWTLGSATGTINVFTHEFATSSGWVKFAATDTYQTLVEGVGQDSSKNFDLRVGVPSSVSDYEQKTIYITIQAIQQ